MDLAKRCSLKPSLLETQIETFKLEKDLCHCTSIILGNRASNISRLYVERGHLDEAVEYFKESLKIVESHYGESSLEFGREAVGLVRLLHLKKDIDACKLYAEKALSALQPFVLLDVEMVDHRVKDDILFLRSFLS